MRYDVFVTEQRYTDKSGAAVFGDRTNKPMSGEFISPRVSRMNDEESLRE